MAASAGTLMAYGATTGRTYSVDVYVPDATATLWTFNPAGLAGTGSPTTWRVPTNEDIILYDFSIAAAPTAVGATIQVNGAPINGGALRHNNQLYSNPNRAKLNLRIAAGDLISALQF